MRSRALLALTVAVLAMAVVGVVAGPATWLGRQLDAVSPEPSPQLFEIESGEPFGRVARRLEEAGLVRNAFAVRLLARRTRSETRLQAGEYEFSPHQLPREILDAAIALENLVGDARQAARHTIRVHYDSHENLGEAERQTEGG